MLCRIARPDDLNATAAALLRDAESAGWRVRVTFASATIDGAEEPRCVESVVLRMRRHPIAAVGSWHNRRYATGYVWSVASPPVKVGARALAAFVKDAA